MELVIMGLISGMNFIIIYIKYTRNRIADATLDLVIFCAICAIFASAGQAGLFVGMVASFIVSIYLWINPPKLGLSHGTN